MSQFSMVVLISGSGSNLQAIIDQINASYLNAQIKCVISNKPDVYGLQRAETHNINNQCLDHTQFDSRESYDAELIKLIQPLSPDIIVLAGFMRILSDSFFHAFKNKIINIHPSLLPKYQGLNTHQRVLDNQDSKHGVSVHIATPELDSGPVIAQASFDLQAEDNKDSLQQKCHQLEHRLYPLVLAWLVNGKLKIDSGGIIFEGKNRTKPLMLDQIDNNELPIIH